MKTLNNNSKAILELLSLNNSTGFPYASFTATKKPKDSKTSINSVVKRIFPIFTIEN